MKCQEGKNHEYDKIIINFSYLWLWLLFFTAPLALSLSLLLNSVVNIKPATIFSSHYKYTFETGETIMSLFLTEKCEFERSAVD